MAAFATISGRLATAPDDACAGDKIVFFMGNAHSGQLSVIRQCDNDTFKYVGTCFIFGWDRSKANIQTINKEFGTTRVTLS